MRLEARGVASGHAGLGDLTGRTENPNRVHIRSFRLDQPTANKSTRNNTNIAIAMKNRILAIRAEAADTPEKPKNPATNDITKNMRANLSIFAVLRQGTRSQ